MTNFSEKALLLMDKVSEDRYPKRVMNAFICQYMLAQTYPDMFDANKKISVFARMLPPWKHIISFLLVLQRKWEK